MEFSRQEYWSGLQFSIPEDLHGPGIEPTSPALKQILFHGATGEASRCRFNPWVKEIPWRRKWQSSPVFLPGKFHAQRSLVGLQSMGSQRVRHNWATKHTAGFLVSQSCLTLCDHMDCSPTRLLCAWDSPGKNSEVACHSLLQGTFWTQGLNSGLLHWRQIVLPSEPQGKPLRLFTHFKFLYSANSNKIRQSLPLFSFIKHFTSFNNFCFVFSHLQDIYRIWAWRYNAKCKSFLYVSAEILLNILLFSANHWANF